MCAVTCGLVRLVVDWSDWSSIGPIGRVGRKGKTLGVTKFPRARNLQVLREMSAR